MSNMTNEEKIKELESTYPINSSLFNEAELSAYKQGLHCGANKMAEWKGEQFQKFIDSLGLTMRTLYNEYKSRRR